MTKVIIIAAGKGSRLGSLTKDLPKTLLKINDKSMLDHQVDVYNKSDLTDINIIVGYQYHKFKHRFERIIHNKEYEKNNILESLFCAEKFIEGDCIISYSDIIFKSEIVEKLIRETSPITIVVDTKWKKSYINRTMHPISEAEKVYFDDNHNLLKVGKDISPDDTNGEFIGMLKINPEGAKIFKKFYRSAKAQYSNNKFFSALSFRKAYITDFLSYLIYNNINLKCMTIDGGWMEIDTPQDYNNAQNFFK
tara:strand:+ start:3685 stop:4434 length:750 start_codon:yes stop_codon:yes gene_type:complete